MNRQLYQMGGPIEEAENFYTNNLGMAPQEARTVLSNALNSYSQNIEPQSMMQMASNGGRIGFSEGGLSEYELLKLKELGYNVRKEGQETFGGISVLKDILKTNKLADGGIARLGYQMGGVSTMPMDYGQSLQVPQQMPTNFSSAQNITMNPLLNYGQTPLTMNRGGIARLGYQMGGEAMMQPQMGGEMGVPQMDPQQALETIIQILIENGISPEQAQQLAQQILQIFAQGGEPAVEAFANQLEQQEQTEAMASGGIAGYGYRQGYGFGGIGKIFSGAAKAVSGVVKGVAGAVKSVAKSPIGKIALTAAAAYFAPLAFGGTTGLGAGSTYGNFFSGIMNPNIVGPLGSTAAEFGRTVGSSFLNPLNIASSALNLGGDKGGLLKTLGVGGIGAALGGLLGPKKEDETDEQYQSRLQTAGPYLKEYYTNLNPGVTPDQVNEFVRLNTSEYGGLGQGNTFAKGGSIVPPSRQIEGGVIELDARKTGGYIPYGKKERVDDVPAMLAKDEFVFTSKAVKAAGNGSAKRGAAKMYAIMKQLEGARA